MSLRSRLGSWGGQTRVHLRDADGSVRTLGPAHRQGAEIVWASDTELLAGGSDGDPFGDSSDRSLSIQVENLTTLDIHVTVVGSEGRRDVGWITGGSLDRFAVPFLLAPSP